MKTANCPQINLSGVIPVSKLPILGVTFDTRYGWASHFDVTIRNASRHLFALHLLRKSLSSAQLILVYNALMRSILEYCSPLFLGMTVKDKVRLERVQDRFHKLMCGRHCKEACLESLTDRRNKMSLQFLQNMKRETHILHDELPPQSSSGRFLLPCRRTARRSRSFIPLVCELYNAGFQRN